MMSQFNARRYALAAALLLGAPATAAAQTDGGTDNVGYGTTSGEFLLLGASARGTALGNAFSAMANDVSALYYNPAGIAMMTRPGAAFSTYTYVADTRYNWGGITFPFNAGTSAIGLHLGTFGFGDQRVYTVEQPEGTGAVYGVNETYVGLTAAQNFSDRFSAGLTAKGIFDQLGDATGSAFAVDFGTNFHATLNNHPIRFSFTLQNLGTNLSYGGTALEAQVPREQEEGEEVPSLPIPAELQSKAFALPTVFRVALAYDLLGGENSRLTMLGDFNQAASNRAGFSGGAEFAADKLGGSGFGFAVRGSYSYQPANNLELASNPTALNDEENLHGLAVGGGLNYSATNFSLGLDYAYKYMGVLGPTNFFSVSLGW